MKLANKIMMGVVFGGSLLATTSCNDFLDKEPISQITPELYFNGASDVAAYVTNYYPTFLINVDGSQLYHTTGWNAGTVGYSDYWSDNLATGTGSGVLSKFGDGSHWLVSADRSLSDTYKKVRIANWVLGYCEPKMDGALSDAESKHYIGEAYMERALAYYVALAQYGDLPIIKEALTDDAEALSAVSVRAPRNEVARFILSDLDKAISLLKDRDAAANGQRFNKQAALLLKSRVALFEGTFEKYHKGSGRVPGDQGWPGGTFSGNIDNEISFFLGEAMSAAKQVADAVALTPNTGTIYPTDGSIYGWNPYFDLFSQPDLKAVPEALLWRGYNKGLGISHNVPVRIGSGNNMGYTRSLVHSFLMKNGLPYYAAGSGYQGDKNLKDEFTDRDERLQLFTWAEDYTRVLSDGTVDEFGLPLLLNPDVEKRVVTGYAPRKCYNYDYNQSKGDDILGTNACVIFRAAEAYLNYMEACYLKNGNLDADAQKYWKALRARAGVDQDYQKTINATDMSKEAEEDWGAYSGSATVDATLFNIRRERRNEFIGENMRYADMLRWRSFDHLLNGGIHVYGINFYDDYKAKYEAAGYDVIVDGSANATLSGPEQGKYINPYRRTDINNELTNGLKWHEAYYLYPIGAYDLELAPSLYQNPNWPTTGGTAATK